MDTNNIKTNIVVTPEEQLKNDMKKERKSIIWGYIWKILLILLVLIIAIRVPYCGSYIDGLIDYVFGLSKYVLYVLLLFVLISYVFQLSSLKIIKTKRFLVSCIIALVCISFIISGICDSVSYFKSHSPNLVTIMNRYHDSWVSYFKLTNYSRFGNTGFFSGGILAVFVSYLINRLSYPVLALIGLTGLVFCIFFIFNINYRSTKIGLKIRGWMVKKLGGVFKYDDFDELRQIKNNQNKFKKASKEDIFKNAAEAETPSFDLLPSSDVVCFNQNFKKAGAIQEKIQEYFKRQKIDAIPSELNVYSTFCELSFEAKNKEVVQQIVEMGNSIAEFAKIDNFNLAIKGIIVVFELPNTFFTKISLKSALSLLDKPKDIISVFALDKKSKPYIQNFRNLPSALILGKKGSGSATLGVLMALSMCYLTKPEDLELRVLSTNSELTYGTFTKIPHTNGKIADGLGECIDQIYNLQTLINQRISKFKTLGVTNIDQYNLTIKNQDDKIKHILVLISNFENIIKESFQNNKIIGDILTNGPKVGVYTILQSYHASNEAFDENIYSVCAQKYILQLNSDAESIRALESERGIQLHGLGDCLTFIKSPKEMERIQVCNINQSELTECANIIQQFYNCKEDKKAPAVEDKKEEIKEDKFLLENKKKTSHLYLPKEITGKTKQIITNDNNEPTSTKEFSDNKVKTTEIHLNNETVFTPFKFEADNNTDKDVKNEDDKQL